MVMDALRLEKLKLDGLAPEVTKQMLVYELKFEVMELEHMQLEMMLIQIMVMDEVVLEL